MAALQDVYGVCVLEREREWHALYCLRGVGGGGGGGDENSEGYVCKKLLQQMENNINPIWIQWAINCYTHCFR